MVDIDPTGPKEALKKAQEEYNKYLEQCSSMVDDMIAMMPEEMRNIMRSKLSYHTQPLNSAYQQLANIAPGTILATGGGGGGFFGSGGAFGGVAKAPGTP